MDYNYFHNDDDFNYSNNFDSQYAVYKKYHQRRKEPKQKHTYRPLHLWIPTKRLLKGIGDKPISNDCLQTIINRIYGSTIEFIEHLLNTRNETEINDIYHIIKQEKLQNESMQHLYQNEDGNPFNILSSTSISHICSYLTKSDINEFKLVSSLIAIECYKEMQKYEIGVFNMKELFNQMEYSNLSLFRRNETNKLLKQSRYNPSTKFENVIDLWSKRYGIDSKNMLFIYSNTLSENLNITFFQHFIQYGCVHNHTFNHTNSFVYQHYKRQYLIFDTSMMILIHDSDKDKLKTVENEWRCAVCTYANLTIKNPLKCEVCNTPNPSPNQNTKQRVILLYYFDFKQQIIKFVRFMLFDDLYQMRDMMIYLMKYIEMNYMMVMKDYFDCNQDRDQFIAIINKMKKFNMLKKPLFRLYDFAQMMQGIPYSIKSGLNSPSIQCIIFSLNDAHPICVSDYMTDIIKYYDIELKETFYRQPFELMNDLYKRLKYTLSSLDLQCNSVNGTIALWPQHLEYICSYLMDNDVICLKNVCKSAALVCFREMRKIKINSINMILSENMAAFWDLNTFKTLPLDLIRNFHRFHKGTTFDVLIEYWCNKYGVLFNNMVLLVWPCFYPSIELTLQALSNKHLRRFDHKNKISLFKNWTFFVFDKTKLSTINIMKIIKIDNNDELNGINDNEEIEIEVENDMDHEGIQLQNQISNDVNVAMDDDEEDEDIDELYNSLILNNDVEEDEYIIDGSSSSSSSDLYPADNVVDSYSGRTNAGTDTGSSQGELKGDAQSIVWLYYFDLKKQQIHFCDALVLTKKDMDTVSTLNDYILYKLDSFLESDDDILHIIREMQQLSAEGNQLIFKISMVATVYKKVVQCVPFEHDNDSPLFFNAKPFHIFVFQLNDQHSYFHGEAMINKNMMYLKEMENYYNDVLNKEFHFDINEILCDNSAVITMKYSPKNTVMLNEYIHYYRSKFTHLCYEKSDSSSAEGNDDESKSDDDKSESDDEVKIEIEEKGGDKKEFSSLISHRVSPQSKALFLYKKIEKELNFVVPSDCIILHNENRKQMINRNQTMMDLGVFFYDVNTQQIALSTQNIYIEWSISPIGLNEINEAKENIAIYNVRVFEPNMNNIFEFGYESFLPFKSISFYIPFKKRFTAKEFIEMFKNICYGLYVGEFEKLHKYFMNDNVYSFVINTPSGSKETMENCFDGDDILEFSSDTQNKISLFIVNNNKYCHDKDKEHSILVRFTSSQDYRNKFSTHFVYEQCVGRPERISIAKTDQIHHIFSDLAVMNYNVYHFGNPTKHYATLYRSKTPHNSSIHDVLINSGDNRNILIVIRE